MESWAVIFCFKGGIELAQYIYNKPVWSKISITTLMKKNCWELKGCGRERGGKNEKEVGLCPAAADERLHGVHGGINAGRACWVVAGTFCDGEVQGTFARKLQDCTLCDFFQQVRKDEGMKYEISLVLLKKLRAIK